MTITLIDTHAHVDYIHRQEGPKPYPDEAGFTDAANVMQRALGNGVVATINPGTAPETFDDVLAMADANEGVYAALAVHPCDVENVPDRAALMARVNELTHHPKVVAVGETGLDYYHDLTYIETQKAFFNDFLAMAVAKDLPVIIHDRDAHQDVAAMVDAHPGVRGVMHCFGGDAAFAMEMVAKGFYISFAGNVTFKNAKDLHEAAKIVPLEHMLVETDSPFLAPVPHRGKHNEPANVRHVAEYIAELRGISMDEVARVTTANACRLFNLPVPLAE